MEEVLKRNGRWERGEGEETGAGGADLRIREGGKE